MAFIRYIEFNSKVKRIILPPRKVLLEGTSFNTIHTQTGAIKVSIISKILTSLAGRLFVPIPISNLEIGDTSTPAKRRIINVLLSIIKLSTKANEIIVIEKPANAVIASLFAFLYFERITKDKANKLTQAKAKRFPIKSPPPICDENIINKPRKIKNEAM